VGTSHVARARRGSVLGPHARRRATNVSMARSADFGMVVAATGKTPSWGGGRSHVGAHHRPVRRCRFRTGERDAPSGTWRAIVECGRRGAGDGVPTSRGPPGGGHGVRWRQGSGKTPGRRCHPAAATRGDGARPLTAMRGAHTRRVDTRSRGAAPRPYCPQCRPFVAVWSNAHPAPATAPPRDGRARLDRPGHTRRPLENGRAAAPRTAARTAARTAGPPRAGARRVTRVWLNRAGCARSRGAGCRWRPRRSR
jgi:hypothetical protein